MKRHSNEISNFPLFLDVLKKFEELGFLDKFILTGSWAYIIYREVYDIPLPLLRTRDADFIIPGNEKFEEINLIEILGEEGFDLDRKGDKGYMTFLNPSLNIEFLMHLKGRDRKRPRRIEELNINVQSLRYLNLLEEYSEYVEFSDMEIRIPHPAAFLIQKMLIIHKRKQSKMERDIRQIENLHLFLGNDKEFKKMFSIIYENLLDGWKRTFRKNCKEYFDKETCNDLMDTR